MTKKPLIRVGPAGWSYKDWEGVVYPQKPGTRFDPLEYLSRFFDTIEINSSFYHSPTANTAKKWVERVARNPRFNFTAKLHRIFTHERRKATDSDDMEFRTAIDALAEPKRLVAVLLQFHWSFKNTDDERAYLLKLLDKFREYPLVLEVRHTSWNNPQILDWLEERGVAICNVDQPLFKKSIKPAALTT